MGWNDRIGYASECSNCKKLNLYDWDTGEAIYSFACKCERDNLNSDDYENQTEIDLQDKELCSWILSLQWTLRSKLQSISNTSFMLKLVSGIKKLF